jgi:hypothetical protein
LEDTAKARRETETNLACLIDNGVGRLAVLGQVKPAGLLEDVGRCFTAMGAGIAGIAGMGADIGK